VPLPRQPFKLDDHPIQYILGRAKSIARFVDHFMSFAELATARIPGTPPAGQARLYMKDDGELYLLNDAGTEYPLTGIDLHTAPPDATDPTAGGGAATGRIPITIDGVGTVYLAYY
jgi:hypothetical protein